MVMRLSIVLIVLVTLSGCAQGFDTWHGWAGRMLDGQWPTVSPPLSSTPCVYPYPPSGPSPACPPGTIGTTK